MNIDKVCKQVLIGVSIIWIASWCIATIVKPELLYNDLALILAIVTSCLIGIWAIYFTFRRIAIRCRRDWV